MVLIGATPAHSFLLLLSETVSALLLPRLLVSSRKDPLPLLPPAVELPMEPLSLLLRPFGDPEKQ